MKLFLKFTIIIILLTPAVIHANEKMQIAVLDFKTRGISANLGHTISDLMRAEMVKTGYFIVVERSQIDKILKEQGFQQTGCTDNECAVELGKILSARKILVGEVSRLGSSILITVRIVDVEKGVAEFAETEKSENENNVDIACRTLTQKLTENIVSNNRNGFPQVSSKNQTFKTKLDIYENSKKSHIVGCCLTSIIPGSQHFYAGNYGTGSLYLLASIASYAAAINMASSNIESNNDKAGSYFGLFCLIRLVDIFHGYYAIENYNSELLKKLDSLSSYDDAEINFNFACNPATNDNQYRLFMSMKF